MSFKKRSKQRGQVVIEYVLLLVISVTIAAFVIRRIGSRGDEPGLLIVGWQKVLESIAKDVPN